MVAQKCGYTNVKSAKNRFSALKKSLANPSAAGTPSPKKPASPAKPPAKAAKARQPRKPKELKEPRVATPRKKRKVDAMEEPEKEIVPVNEEEDEDAEGEVDPGDEYLVRAKGE